MQHRHPALRGERADRIEQRIVRLAASLIPIIPASRPRRISPSAWLV
jgi:hypothetical protein